MKNHSLTELETKTFKVFSTVSRRISKIWLDSLSDDDFDHEIDKKNNCDQCEYTCEMESNLKKHVKSEHTHSCEQCDFMTSNKMHLKMHVKACHKKNEQNENKLPKKRKSMEVIPSSRKKTKINVVSKKVRKVQR